MAAARANPTLMQKSGKGHTYYLDGEKVPGVTTILGNGLPKPALVGWGASTVADFVVNRLAVARNPEGKTRIVADDVVRDALEWNASRDRAVAVGNEALPRLALAKILADIRYRDLAEAAAKGSDVHHLAERLARGEEVLVPEHLAGHVTSYLGFLEEWRPANAVLEFVVGNRRWKYMGKGDLIADFPGIWDGGPWDGLPIGRGLLDIKTARSGIFAEVALQVEAYRRAEFMLQGAEEVPMPAVDWVGAIHVRADGYDVVAFDTDEDTFRTFLYAKQIGEWLDWKEGAASRIKTDALRPPIVDEEAE